MAIVTDTLTLNSGADMPVIGLGTWKVNDALKTLCDLCKIIDST